MINIGYYHPGQGVRYAEGLGALKRRRVVATVLPSSAPRRAVSQSSLVATPTIVHQEFVANSTPVPQPTVMHQARQAMVNQAYAQALEAATPGDTETRVPLTVIAGEGSPSQPGAEGPIPLPEGLTRPRGEYVPQPGDGTITSMSPALASERTDGTFLKTWGPPLVAIAGIGLAVWILRS